MFRRTRAAAALALSAVLLAASATAPAYADPKQADTVQQAHPGRDARGCARAPARPSRRSRTSTATERLDAQATRRRSTTSSSSSRRPATSRRSRSSRSPTTRRTPSSNGSPRRRGTSRKAPSSFATLRLGEPRGQAPATGIALVRGRARRRQQRLRGDRLRRHAAGSIALMQRGGCEFRFKALNAQAAGAAGAIIWNNTTGMVSMIGDATGLTIPTVFASQEGRHRPRQHSRRDCSRRRRLHLGREDGVQRPRRDQARQRPTTS